MKSKLIIIGAGGHGKVCADIAMLNGYQDVVFLDDHAADRIAVAGPASDFTRYLSDGDFFVAIGNNTVRKNFIENILSAGGTLVSLIHPASTVAETVSIGIGSVIMAGAVINPGAAVGKGVIINTCSSVDHDCVIGDYTHIAVGAHLAGTIHIGEGVMIGAGATVINNLTVPDHTVIGAGGVVIKSISEKGTYVGVPVGKIGP